MLCLSGLGNSMANIMRPFSVKDDTALRSPFLAPPIPRSSGIVLGEQYASSIVWPCEPVDAARLPRSISSFLLCMFARLQGQVSHETVVHKLRPRNRNCRTKGTTVRAQH